MRIKLNTNERAITEKFGFKSSWNVDVNALQQTFREKYCEEYAL
jgi:hypothetical protein